ncbi:MAG TPA: cytochrome c-type biogenesis protein CcmH [Devosia sp.]|nr:cytochrome c-type biogenesis protein CcmH [Devosia sp.]
MRALLFALLMVFAASPAFAVNPDEILADPALEARARAISAHLRCLVCQNQSIDDSDADLARDLRVLVRERLVAGDTDAAATQYIVDRYGEYVLLNPVIAPHTIALWVAAPGILAIGIVAVLIGVRRRRAVPTAGAPLTAEESAALAELEGSGKGK